MNDIYNYVDYVYLKLNDEYEFSLSKRQIMNIAVNLLKYNITDEEFLTALEYASKIRTTIKFYITHVLYPYNTKWNYYNTIDYAINRALGAMGIIEPEIKIIQFNDRLEQEIYIIENEIKLNNMHVKKLY